MTETENAIPYSGLDPAGRLKFGVLLELFQQMANIDATKYGLSVHQTLEHDITWVLRKYRVDLERYPAEGDGSIRIKTYAEPFHNLFSLRSFKCWNERGDFLGSAYTWWVLLDVKKMRPIRFDKCELTSAYKEKISEELPADVKVPEVTDPQIEETWKVRWQDLDLNDHTNHTVYFGWALDTVPPEVPEKLSPMLAEGEYLRPVPRTKVRCLTQEIPCESGRSFLHSLRHIEDDTEYAKFSSVWR